MKIADKVAAVAGSPHAGRALKAAKVLNLVGTVRGAVATALLASSAIGGAVTVNNVRQDLAAERAAPSGTPARAQSGRTTPAPTASPLTAAGVRADAERRLRLGLDQDAAAVEDLRTVSVLSAAATDALVLQTRQKLEARFDQALGQVDQLLAAASASPPASASPRPSAAISVVAVNALVQVALNDMSALVVGATKVATTVAPPIVAQSPRPTPAPAIRTPSPTAPRPLPTR